MPISVGLFNIQQWQSQRLFRKETSEPTTSFTNQCVCLWLCTSGAITENFQFYKYNRFQETCRLFEENINIVLERL